MKRTKVVFIRFGMFSFCYLLITKEKDLAFGIGISYGFKDRVKELIHPIEYGSIIFQKAFILCECALGWKRVMQGLLYS